MPPDAGRVSAGWPRGVVVTEYMPQLDPPHVVLPGYGTDGGPAGRHRPARRRVTALGRT